MLCASAVTVNWALKPGARVKVAGVTVTGMVLGATTCAVQVSVLVETFLMEFIHEQLTTQLPLAKDALSKVRPALLTRSRSTLPAPISNGSAGATPSDLVSVWIAVEVNAVFTWIGVHVGCCCITRAAEPVICGADMLVPWKKSYTGSVAPGVNAGEIAERILTPGAVISGLSILGSALGPLELKLATISA